LGSAGDEREFDVVPVFADGVVHDGPALEERFFAGFAWQNDAIGRLPNGDFADVADVELAVAGAFGGESHAAEILLADGGEQVKILADFVSEVRLGELDGDGGSELDAADFAGIADDGGEVDSRVVPPETRVLRSTLRRRPVTVVAPVRTWRRAPRRAP
jgi:hypothetical protein